MRIADIIKSSIINKRIFKGSVIVDEVGLPIKNSWDKNFYADAMEITKDNKIIIYEVKSCLSDYRSDKKWMNYLQFCDLFYFIASKEVIAVIKEEVPKTVGLYTFYQSGNKTYLECTRVARKHGEKIDSIGIKEHLYQVNVYRMGNIHAKKIKEYWKLIKTT